MKADQATLTVEQRTQRDHAMLFGHFGHQGVGKRMTVTGRGMAAEEPGAGVVGGHTDRHC